MHRLASLPIVLATLAPVSGTQAQIAPDAPAPRQTDEDRALLELAGPRARMRSEGGRTRMLVGAHIAPWSGDPARDAVAVVARFARALGVPHGADLRVASVQRWHGFTIVRLTRFEGGAPVIGASIVVRFLADGAIDLVASSPGPARVHRADPPIAAESAAAIARAVPTGWPEVRVVATSAAGLVVDDAVVPIWQVDVHGPAPSQRARAMIDARDGRVLAFVPLIVHAIGRVYATNPETDMGVPTEVELANLTSLERMTGRYFRVASCNAQADRGCAPLQIAQADEDGNFLFDPMARAYDDPFAEVNAYHHLDVAAAYHRARHGFTWTCGASSVMRVYVNYAERAMVPYDNAAFAPGSGGDCGFLMFGQGASNDYAYDADVVYHEYGHAVTDAVATLAAFASDSLGVSYEPLALNEGTSDFYAATIQGNPEIAESFAASGGLLGGHGSLRELDGALRCPSSLFGEGHQDGRIWGGLAWDLRVSLGAELADRLVFATIASSTSSASLAEAGELLVATAMGMRAMGMLGDADLEQVRAAVAERGLVDCRRIVPLDDGDSRNGWSGHEYITGNAGQSVAPVHYRIDVPADAVELRLRVNNLTPAGRYTLHFGVGHPVRVAITRIFSHGSASVEGSTVTLVDGAGPLPLPRCQTLYIAVQSTDLRTAGQNVYRIGAQLLRSEDPEARCPVAEPDAGPPLDAAMDEGGVSHPPSEHSASGGGACACRAGTRMPLPAVALAAIGIAVLGVRRRRGPRRSFDQIPSHARASSARVPRRT